MALPSSASTAPGSGDEVQTVESSSSHDRAQAPPAVSHAAGQNPAHRACSDPERSDRERCASTRFPAVALLVAAAAVAVRLPAFISDRHLTFDDGVYGASAVAMRHGGIPFREVFSSQGPLHLPLVFVADLIGFRQANSPRLLGVLAGIAMMVAAWGVVRAARGSSGHALAAAGIVGFTGSVLWVSAPVASDAPALALATACVWAALAYRHRPSHGMAAVMGLLAGLAASEKAMVIPCLVPCAFVLLEAARVDVRRLADTALAGIVCLATILVVSLPWGLSDVWDQSVAYHTEAASQRTPGANMRKVSSTLFDRDLWLLAGIVGALVSALFVRGRDQRSASGRRADGMSSGPDTLDSAPSHISEADGPVVGERVSAVTRCDRQASDPAKPKGALTHSAPSRPAVSVGAEPATGDSASSPSAQSPRSADHGLTGDHTSNGSALLWGPDWVPILCWLLATVALLAWTHPLWRPHVAHLAPPIAVLIALSRPNLKVLLIALILVAPIHAWRLSDFLDPAPRSRAELEARAYIDELPEGAWVISDEPGIPWRDNRRTTDDLVDTSILRIEAGRITADSLALAAADPHVCGFLIWRRTHFGSFEELPAKLAADGYDLVAEMAHGRSFWAKEDCSVPHP